MRTDSPSPTESPTARLRGGLSRARRLAEQVARGDWSRTAAARWTYRLGPASARHPWVVGAIVSITTAVAFSLLYVTTLTSSTATNSFVRAGERFSRDDLETIKRALHAKHVAFRVDDQGRVQVAADLLETADEAVAKLDVGPRPLPEIQKQALESSLLDTPGSKEQRQEQAQIRLLEEMIRRINGITSATVKINRPRPRLGQRAPSAATALVYLDTEDDRELNDSTVQSIIRFVSDFDPDVRPDAVSIYDRKFQHYALAHDPTASARARDRARSEDFRREIAKEIDWIKGVQVSVRLVPAASPGNPSPLQPAVPLTTVSISASAAAPVAMPAPAPGPASVTAPPQAPVPASASIPLSSLPPLPADPPPPPPPPPAAEELQPGEARSSVAANRPLEIDAPEPAPPGLSEPLPVRLLPTPVPTVMAPPPATTTTATTTPPTPGSAPIPAVEPATPAPAPASAPAAAAATASLAQVLVKVPRSYYLKIAPRREPSLEELHPLMSRIEAQIETAVRHVIPPDQFGRVSITTIADELPAPAPPPPSADARRATPWWLHAAAGAGAGGALIAALFRLAGARRSVVPRPQARADRGRFKIDEAPDDSAGPGPSERVRELIRTSPEAAASVLHRWTGQGGPIA